MARGANLAVTLWPGEKVIGGDLCYNSAAVYIDKTGDAFKVLHEHRVGGPFSRTDFP